MYERLRTHLAADRDSLDARHTAASAAADAAAQQREQLLAVAAEHNIRLADATSAHRQAVESAGAAAGEVERVRAMLQHAENTVRELSAQLDSFDRSKPTDGTKIRDWLQDRRQLAGQLNAAERDLAALRPRLPVAEQSKVDSDQALAARTTDLAQAAAEWQMADQAATAADAATAAAVRERDLALEGLQAVTTRLGSLDERAATLTAEPLDRERVAAAADAEWAELLDARAAQRDAQDGRAAAVAERHTLQGPLDRTVDDLAGLRDDLNATPDGATETEALRELLDTLLAAAHAHRSLPPGDRADRPGDDAATLASRLSDLRGLRDRTDTERENLRTRFDEVNSEIAAHGQARPPDFTGTTAAEAEEYRRALERWQAEEPELLRKLGAAQEDWAGADLRLGRLDDRITRLDTAVAALDGHAQALAPVDARLAESTTRLRRADDEVNDLAAAADTGTARLLGSPDGTVPAVLVPIRLETRWLGRTLEVRFLPDELTADPLDERLTPSETADGARYRAAVDEQAAWEELVQRCGPRRAALIVRETAGTPAPRKHAEHRPVPIDLMPTRFALVAWAGGRPIDLAPPGQPPRFTVWGEPVRDKLSVNPLTGPDTWLTSTEDAIAAGMAARVEIPESTPAIELLTAVGVRTGDPAGTGAHLDRILLDRRPYSAGVEILPDSATTNNTAAQASLLDPARERNAARQLITDPTPFSPVAGSAGEQLGRILGTTASWNRIAGAGAARAAEHAAMRLLVGLGARGSLRDTLGGAAHPVWDLVEPGGPAPVLRIGTRVHGVLPVTAPQRWRAGAGEVSAGLAEVVQNSSRASAPAEPPGTPPAAGSATAWGPPAGTDAAVFSGPGSVVGEDPAGFLTGLAGAAPPAATQRPASLLGAVATAAKRRSADPSSGLPGGTAVAVDAALRLLAGLDTRRLASLLGNYLDTLSHRTDPWVTAAVTERLLMLRRDTPGSGLTGAYGWTTAVAPRTDTVTHGHLLAPSAVHAATAAVLRTGFLAERSRAWDGELARATTALADATASGDIAAVDAARGRIDTASAGRRELTPLPAATEDGLPLAIDLSSRRVRGALRVLDGVRAGQPLGAVLGYEFERELAAAGLQAHLGAFRTLSRFRTGTRLEELELTRAAARRLRDETNREKTRTAEVHGAAVELAAQKRVDRDAAAGRASAATAELNRQIGLANELASAEAAASAAADALTRHSASKPLPRRRRVPIPMPEEMPNSEIRTRLHDVDLLDPVDPVDDTNWRAEHERLVALAQATAGRLSAARAAYLPDHHRAAEQADLVAGETYRAAESAAAKAEDAEATAETAKTSAAQTAEKAATDLAAAVDTVAEEMDRLLREATTSATFTAAVDGLALRGRYRAGVAADPPRWDAGTVPFPDGSAGGADPLGLGLPAVGSEGHDRLLAVLARLDAHVDAVADLVASEAVHQLVAGNADRAAASIDLTAAVPDVFEVVRTPTRGHDVTHRVVVLLDTAAPPGTGLPEFSVAARLDPVLTRWLATLLPMPGTVTARAGDGTPVTVDLARIGLDPLGWLRVAADPAELTQRIARAVRAVRADPDDAIGPVQVEQSPDLTALLVAASEAGRLLAATRALAPSDLAVAGRPPDHEPVHPDVETRLTDAEDAVADLIGRLTDATDPTTPVSTSALVDLLLDATAIGVAEATPSLDGSTLDRTALRLQAGAAASRLRHRLAERQENVATPAAARRRAAALAGIMLPLITPVGPIGGPAWASGPPGAEPGRVRAWLLDHARVRPAVDSLCRALDASLAFGGTAALDVRAVQLPHGGGVAWAGGADRPEPGLTSIVVQRGHTGDAVPSAPGGLVVDAWTETVPGSRHAPAVAVHVDRPGTVPPHAVLVAVPPTVDDSPFWTLDTLLGSVVGALDASRARAVPPEALPDTWIEVDLP